MVRVGGRFLIGLAAVAVAICVGVAIALWIAGAAMAAWGFWGAFLAFCAVALFVGWMVDRRRPKLDRV
jgi:membrane protein implicated in regulation of membrane protease activity